MALNNFKSVQKTLGLLLMVFSCSMLVPFVVSGIFGDTYTASSFLASFTFTLLAGLLIWLPSRKAAPEIRLKEGFIIVASFWIILALFGSIPFWLYFCRLFMDFCKQCSAINSAWIFFSFSVSHDKPSHNLASELKRISNKGCPLTIIC